MYRRKPQFLVAVGVLLCAVAMPVRAGAVESVAMPFACSVDGAQVVLKPSDVKSYPVLGEREERQITTCAAPGSVLCRTMIAHRFQISCGGRRVAWMRVVAAAHRSAIRPMWVERGRLHLAVERRDRPAARCLDDGRMSVGRYASGSRGSRFGLPMAECMPWQRERLLPHVTLPPGFAPLGDIGAKLVIGAESAARPEPVVVAALPPDRVTQVPPAPPAAAPAPVAEELPRIERAYVASEPLPDIQPIPVVLTGAESARSWITMVRSEPMAGVPSFGPGPTQTAWLAATLLAGLLATVAWAMWRVERAPASARRDRRKGDRGVRSRAGAAGATTANDVPPVTSATSVANAAASVTALIEQAGGSIDSLVSAPPLREVLEHELGVIRQRLAIVKAQASDSPEAAHKAAPAFRTLVRDLERVRRISESAALSFSGRRVAGRLPRSRSEAYDALGVHADVSMETLKRLVDALRMCWHPDLARDETDRLNREERIKCINVAWELISGKRSPA